MSPTAKIKMFSNTLHLNKKNSTNINNVNTNNNNNLCPSQQLINTDNINTNKFNNNRPQTKNLILNLT